MAGSTWGTIFRITTWGESHGEAVGVVIDGCPAGLTLSASDIQPYLDRRSPGKSRYATARAEQDQITILSGLYEGKTTGTPISLLVRNENAQSNDYRTLADVYRPGHADYAYQQKYGLRDPRGGGRSSGRETIGRVAAGAIAAKLLQTVGIRVWAYAESIGPIQIANCDRKVREENPLCMPDAEAARQASSFLESCMEKGDSAGGVIACLVENLPAGLGDPVFEKLDANLAKAVLSIGAIKGISFGAGFAAAAMTGSEHNDPFIAEGDSIRKASNHAGGILGGISDGADLFLRAACKPTPSISIPQQTVRADGKATSLSIHGRHDPVIVPRAVVVVESMVALTLADALLLHLGSRVDHLQAIYQK